MNTVSNMLKIFLRQIWKTTNNIYILSLDNIEQYSRINILIWKSTSLFWHNRENNNNSKITLYGNFRRHGLILSDWLSLQHYSLKFNCHGCYSERQVLYRFIGHQFSEPLLVEIAYYTLSGPYSFGEEMLASSLIRRVRSLNSENEVIWCFYWAELV